MGFLSCFSPLLPSSRTTSTSSIGDALLDEKSYMEDHAVATRPREDKSARKLAALRAKMEEAGLGA